MTRLYVGLTIALIALCGLQATHQPWSGDFWEHAAIVRELAAHPVTPRHPLLDLPTPHPLFTPYHLGMGLLARSTGVDAVDVLTAAGLVNLALLCFALWQLAATWTGNRRAAPWLLLFSLFFWGHEPWRWSGMLHFGALGRIAAYPSIVGLSLALLVLAAASRYLATGTVWLLALLGALSASVMLIHPLTLPTVVFGTAALCWRDLRVVPMRRALAPAVAVAIGCLAACAWPYFPVLRLFMASGDAYDLQQYPIYARLVERAFPILLALPLLALRLRKDARDPVAITWLSLTGVMALGYATHRFTLGRLLPGAILMVHLALADWMASTVGPWLASSVRRSRTTAFAIAVALLGSFALIGANFADSWELCSPSHTHVLAPYEFLRETVGPGDVVLANAKTSAIVPVIAGRVVAVNNALPFVPDAKARREAVSTFFATGTGDGERRRIVDAYGVRWVLVDRDGSGRDQALEDWLRTQGPVAHEDARFLLVSITRAPR